MVAAFTMAVAGVSRSLFGHRDNAGGSNAGWEVRDAPGSLAIVADDGPTAQTHVIGAGYDDGSLHILATGINYASGKVWYRSDLTPAGSSAALTITTGGANGRPFTLGALASGLRL